MPSVIQTAMLILAPLGRPLSSQCVEWIQNKTGLLVRWNYLPKRVTDTQPPVRNYWYDRPVFKTFYYSTFLPFLCTHECKQIGLVSPIKLNNSAPLTHLPSAFWPCFLLSDSPSFQKYLLIILCQPVLSVVGNTKNNYQKLLNWKRNTNASLTLYVLAQYFYDEFRFSYFFTKRKKI